MTSVDFRPDRSTAMYSGRSFGRQAISTSDITWLTIAADSLTAGEFSWPVKCSGTRMWIGWSSATRWKSMCSTCCLYGCIW